MFSKKKKFFFYLDFIINLLDFLFGLLPLLYKNSLSKYMTTLWYPHVWNVCSKLVSSPCRTFSSWGFNINYLKRYHIFSIEIHFFLFLFLVYMNNITNIHKSIVFYVYYVYFNSRTIIRFFLYGKKSKI